MSRDDPDTGPLSRRSIDARRLTVPLTVIVGAAVVVGGWIWWLAAANARLEVIERTQAEQAKVQAAQDARLGDVRVREAEILTKLGGIEVQLAEIKLILRDRRP